MSRRESEKEIEGKGGERAETVGRRGKMEGRKQ